MKLLGAIFIFMATTWIGFELARRLSERPRQLRQLKVALQSLEAEMLYGLSPLAEATENIAKQFPQPVASLFERFSFRLREKEDSVYEAWHEAIKETWGYTDLLQSEQEVLLQFGTTLGQHDREQQQKQIRLTLAHLEREEGEAKERQHRYERMMKSLGVLTGLLLIILML
ncbi:stage III sporulation protein SpoIIIAB [Halalkalibacterium ligniniphilum]|uniref:stage III sporulation protein SpoIIIAB n=1 Tax=Halalkalibacterium ligniniphilum TaxID=1134413 RepID=UPI0003498376|nr:stage III sporulation protein SpoIIIAB [Halalkalibacterium ligniniphilum]